MTQITSRIETTLFLLTSVDGKITSGESDELDSGEDWKRIRGVKEGLQQYYDIEAKQASRMLCCLNTGRTLAKVGFNSRTEIPGKEPFSFVVIDQKPHLTEQGVRYLARWLSTVYFVTNNRAHPAFALKPAAGNIEIIEYSGKIDLPDLLVQLKQVYGLERLLVQSGGTLNAHLVRQGLIDHVLIVVAPLLVGGKNTSSLIDGASLQVEADLNHLKALKLVRCDVLEGSYIRLEYDVVNKTIID